MSRKARMIKQQKQLQKKFAKNAAKGNGGKQRKDKYAHFKGKHVTKPNEPNQS